jgi:hypothetical protein
LAENLISEWHRLFLAVIQYYIGFVDEVQAPCSQGSGAGIIGAYDPQTRSWVDLAKMGDHLSIHICIRGVSYVQVSRVGEPSTSLLSIIR